MQGHMIFIRHIVCTLHRFECRDQESDPREKPEVGLGGLISPRDVAVADCSPPLVLPACASTPSIKNHLYGRTSPVVLVGNAADNPKDRGQVLCRVLRGRIEECHAI